MPPIKGGDIYLTPLNMVDNTMVNGLQNATKQQLYEIEAILCKKT